MRGRRPWSAEPLGSALRLQSGPVKLWQPLSADGEGRSALPRPALLPCVHRGSRNLGKPGFCFKGHEEVRRLGRLPAAGACAPRDTASFLSSVSPTRPTPDPRHPPAPCPPQLTRPPAPANQIGAGALPTAVRPRPRTLACLVLAALFIGSRLLRGKGTAQPSRRAPPTVRSAAAPRPRRLGLGLANLRTRTHHCVCLDAPRATVRAVQAEGATAAALQASQEQARQLRLPARLAR